MKCCRLTVWSRSIIHKRSNAKENHPAMPRLVSFDFDLSITRGTRIGAVVFVLFCIVGICFGQTLRTTGDYNNRGLQRQNAGDLEGAIEDYTTAISLKGKNIEIATAYNNRASV